MIEPCEGTFRLSLICPQFAQLRVEILFNRRLFQKHRISGGVFGQHFIQGGHAGRIYSGHVLERIAAQKPCFQISGGFYLVEALLSIYHVQDEV